MTLSERDWAALQLMGVAPWPKRPAVWLDARASDAPALEEDPPVVAKKTTSALIEAAPESESLRTVVEAVEAVEPAASVRPRPVPTPAPRTLTPKLRIMDSSVPSTAHPLSPIPVPADLQALDWVGLRQKVADCRACGLCESRRQTVFGVGSTQAHWMIVGEAPGEQEDLLGEPFVGPAGQLLDRMLAALGLSRAEDVQAEETAITSEAAPVLASALGGGGDELAEGIELAQTADRQGQRDANGLGAQVLKPEQQVYIANTLKCRPPRNRNPEPEELARCEPYLHRQIDLLRPRVILAMGRFAVQRLLRTEEAIGRLRGRVHRYQDIPVIVTYHPAYLLRNPIDKAKAWADLCLAADVFEQQL
jgi:uracil-DNA glycosylase